uniref:Uncharacterized protein n=1 Tax=Pararge aegeria TaxID=116150 RepID=S4NH39_9NEOP
MERTCAFVFWVKFLTLIAQSEAGIPLNLRCSSRPGFSTFSRSAAPPYLEAEPYLSFLPSLPFPAQPDCSTECTPKPTIKTVVILHKCHNNDDTNVEIVITKGKKQTKDGKEVQDENDDDEASTQDVTIHQTTTTINQETNGEQKVNELQNKGDKKVEVTKQETTKLIGNKNDNNDQTIKKEIVYQTITNSYALPFDAGKVDKELPNKDDSNLEISKASKETLEGKLISYKYDSDKMADKNVTKDVVPNDEGTAEGSEIIAGGTIINDDITDADYVNADDEAEDENSSDDDK